MLGGSVWIRMKSNLFQLIEGQSHISSSRYAKMSLTLKNPFRMVFVKTSTLPPPSMHSLEIYGTWKVLYANQPTPNQKLMLT